ncbi:carboxypeptidase-like regulatory domain-containing protein [Gimesia aquarii]|nr:carboxypeptidase-like regulatory domain-containing protein [Gimesia aquarii]
MHKSRLLSFTTLVVFLCYIVGCGSKETGPELTAVTGSVLLNEKPLANADLHFIPVESTPGVGGEARTKASGEFNVVYSRGGEGLPAGNYRVTVSYRLMPDGSPVPEGDTTPPIESPASETLPGIYSDYDKSQLKATVAPGKPVEIKLITKK